MHFGKDLIETKNFGCFYHSILLLYVQQNIFLDQSNISVVFNKFQVFIIFKLNTWLSIKYFVILPKRFFSMDMIFFECIYLLTGKIWLNPNNKSTLYFCVSKIKICFNKTNFFF